MTGRTMSMLPDIVTVKAATEAEAKQAAAKDLGVGPADLSLRPLAQGAFEASVLNRPAQIDIAISDDKLTAFVSDYRAPKGSGRPLALQDVGLALKEAGVAVTPDAAMANAVVSDAGRGKDVVGMVLAKGYGPTPAKDARLEPVGNLDYPVFPHDGFAKIAPAEDAKPGKAVDGAAIMPQGEMKGRFVDFQDEDNCYIDQNALVLRAEVYGLVFIQGQKVTVRPLLRVSRDGMEAMADIYHQDFRGQMVTLDRMQAALAADDIKERPDGSALAKAVAESKAKDIAVKGVVVCRGVLPRDGKDGWFQRFYEDDANTIGLETDDGRVDFRARGLVRAVKPGSILGRLHPPQPGVPGRDVRGMVIPAKDGVKIQIKAGDGVETDGTTYKAVAEGIVILAGGLIQVSDVYETRGDVNLSTGNINIEKGSVIVHGSILSGFSVSAPGNILVDEVIESAKVKAGGDVEVKGGVIMDKGGQVQARGNLSVAFAKNAVISAEGDVSIANEANNCVIYARGKVVALSGKGKIVGGAVRCGEGLYVNELGSELGVETAVHLGLERETNQEALTRKKQLKATLQKIYGVLGSGNPKEILTNAPPAKRKAVAELLKTRLGAEAELKEVEDQLELERRMMRDASAAVIKVKGAIHPGVVINCFGVTMPITSAVSYSKIWFDMNREQLVIGSL